MQLFIDMDGVLADFDSGYEQRFGTRPSKADDNVDWELVKRTEGFYRELPPMPDFEKLWHSLEWLNPIILTGVPLIAEAPQNKREWVDKNIGKHAKMIACRSKEKCHHANVGDVLIDDWEKYKHLWTAKGGVWITHVSADNSLEQLSHHIRARGQP